MLYSRTVIVLFGTGLYKPVFSTYSFDKTRFSYFSVLIFPVSVDLALIFSFPLERLKGATKSKSYFTHYSSVVIIFLTVSCRSAFSTYSFGKLVFRISLLSVFFKKLNILNQDFIICDISI